MIKIGWKGPEQTKKNLVIQACVHILLFLSPFLITAQVQPTQLT